MCLGNFSVKCNLSLKHSELKLPESYLWPDKEGLISVTADLFLYFLSQTTNVTNLVNALPKWYKDHFLNSRATVTRATGYRTTGKTVSGLLACLHTEKTEAKAEAKESRLRNRLYCVTPHYGPEHFTQCHFALVSKGSWSLWPNNLFQQVRGVPHRTGCSKQRPKTTNEGGRHTKSI